MEWGERYISIPARGNAEPGPIRIRERTPFHVQILRDLTDSYTQLIVVMKGVQIGGSTIMEIALGYWIDCWGDPILLCFPTEAATKERLKDKISPLIRNNPRLARWVSDDRNAISKDSIDLIHCTVYPAWSGSPQAMASRAIRCVVEDETDKQRKNAGEASAGELLDVRTTTFGHRRKHGRLSTPTTSLGEISLAFENIAAKRRWHVPCPRCGVLILLSFDQVSWPGQGAEDPKELMRQVAALEAEEIHAEYTCQDCGGVFGEAEKQAIQQDGMWVQEGHPPGELPQVVSVAYHIPSINSPWVTLNKLAIEFLKCELRGDRHNFLNNYLALPCEESERALSESLFAERADHTPYEVPEWATAVTAGADTQKDHWWYVVRAWGPSEDGRLRSKLLDFGKALSVADLRAKTVDAKFPVEGRPGYHVQCRLLMVDSGGGVENLDGTTRDTVYQMALADPHRVVAIKGHGGVNAPDAEIKISPQRYLDAKAGPQSVKLAILDTQGLKDQLNDLIQAEDPVLWFENAHVDDEYAAHMSGEIKTLEQSGKRMVMRWQPKRQGRHVDLWDASVYCLAAAKSLRALKRAPEFQQQVRQAPQPMARPVAQPRYSGGWISKRPRGR